MERKECDENFVSVKVCQERHTQIQIAHEAKHGDVVEKLKAHAEVIRDVDKEVSENFKHVHERIDEFMDTIVDTTSQLTALVNDEVKGLMEKVNNIQNSLKNMMISILISILISVIGAGVSFVLSEKKSPENGNASIVLELKKLNDKIDVIGKR